MKSEIKITLSEYGPPMWFFEDGQYKAHLTFEPGSNSITFELDKLSEQGVAYLIGSIQGGLVVADVALADLFKHLEQVQTPQVELPIEQPDPLIEELNKKFFSSEARRYKRLDELEERCANLAKSSFRALRAGLANEKNQFIISKVLELEKQNKRRKTVLVYLQEKLKSLRHEKIGEILKEKIPLSRQEETASMGYNVSEEEDIEIVDFDVVSIIEPLEEGTG